MKEDVKEWAIWAEALGRFWMKKKRIKGEKCMMDDREYIKLLEDALLKLMDGDSAYQHSGEMHVLKELILQRRDEPLGISSTRPLGGKGSSCFIVRENEEITDQSKGNKSCI